jgi:signal transduction histidine kinase
MEEELKRSHEMKIFGQLAAGVAHEVRNPLNAILAITEALFQDIGDNPEYLLYLEHIQNQVTRLSILMKDLLEIGKPISRDSFQPETVAGIVTSTINLWGTIELSKGHALRFISQSESEKKYLKTDIARFQQVILNLLQNAAQNSPEGSEIVIQVLEPRYKTVNIHIIDRGTGIPPDNLLYVFEPFFTTRKGGTGLGLNIVKHFVESMGGNVAIWNNDPPPGCTVELRLPIATDSES